MSNEGLQGKDRSINRLFAEINSFFKKIQKGPLHKGELARYKEIPFHPEHRGDIVKIGPYNLRAGALINLRTQDLSDVDTLVSLNYNFQPPKDLAAGIIRINWPDFNPPPKDLELTLKKEIIPLLEQQKKLLVFCTVGHGRTGTFLASLISLTEPETVDPIAAVRERYCKKAVETLEQGESIFALRGQQLPEKYIRELRDFIPPSF